jgi:hypothetical protein
MNHRIAICAVALSAFAASAFAAACGGEQPEAAHPANPPPSAEAPASSAAPAASSAPAASTAPAASAPAASASAAPPGPPGPGDWDKWSHDQKLAYMKSDVLPKMSGLFHDFDAKTYAEPKCVLCHGGGVKDGGFKMPNPELPKLDVTPAGFKKMQEGKKKAVFEFMAKQVVPTMAQLLGEQPYDPKTQKGFGCMECHTKK